MDRKSCSNNRNSTTNRFTPCTEPEPFVLIIIKFLLAFLGFQKKYESIGPERGEPVHVVKNAPSCTKILVLALLGSCCPERSSTFLKEGRGSFFAFQVGPFFI